MFCILPCQHHIQRILASSKYKQSRHVSNNGMFCTLGFENSSSWALNNHSTRVPRGSQCFLNNQRKPPVLNIFWIGLNWTWEIVLNWTWEIVYRKKIEMFAPVSASTHEHSCLSNHNCTTTIVYQPQYCEPLLWTLLCFTIEPLLYPILYPLADQPTNDGIAKDSLSSSVVDVYVSDWTKIDCKKSTLDGLWSESNCRSSSRSQAC